MSTVVPMPVGLWREGLHQLLWEQRYGDDLVVINQAALAESLQITRANLNRAIKAMITAGWITLVDGHIYKVAEPEVDTAEE